MKPINANRQVLDPNYVSGLTDGEGSFCVSLSPRPKLNVKWEVRPSFSISQNFRSRGVLYQIKDFFGCGSVRESKSDQTWKYEVRSLDDLIIKIAPHFWHFPLKTSKQADFEIFDQVLAMMKNDGHLHREGLKAIFAKIKSMNPSGKRKYQNLTK